MELFEIPVTQYMRPGGRKVEVFVKRPKEIYEKAMKIIENGYRFEAEVLNTNDVSLTVSDEEIDYCCELTHNIPGAVTVAFDRLINKFYKPKGGKSDV